MICYQIKVIIKSKDKRTATILATQPKLKRYNELVQQSRQKSKARKALVAEQKNTSKLNLIKQHDLSRPITTLTEELEENMPCEISLQTRTNMPARIRMTATYAVSQSVNGRVANTCNLSEDWVGYSTRYGDSVGDFSPLSTLTVQEVKAVGRRLGLPDVLFDKIPLDGLSGLTD